MEGSEAPEDRVRRLLANVVETYLPLEGSEAEHFEEQLRLPENEGLRDSMKTWEERIEEIGEARGEARGKLQGKQEAVLRVLEAKFGPLPADLVARVRAITSEAELDALLVQGVQGAHLADVKIP